MAGLPPMQRDANYRTVNTNESFITTSDWTFSAATTGSVGAHNVFTVTGDVLVCVFGLVNTSVTGTGTGEVGFTGNTTTLIAQTTGTGLVSGTVWTDATPGVAARTIAPTKIVNNGLPVVLTIGTGTLTAGMVRFYCLWRPLSRNGSVVATTPA